MGYGIGFVWLLVLPFAAMLGPDIAGNGRAPDLVGREALVIGGEFRG